MKSSTVRCHIMSLIAPINDVDYILICTSTIGSKSSLAASLAAPW